MYLCPAYEDYQRRYATELVAECEHQREEIDRRRELYRAVRPHADLASRTVIVTDDGIATGSTMIAALMALTDKHAHEVIAAVPVAAPDRLEEIRPWCDEIVCLDAPESFRACEPVLRELRPGRGRRSRRSAPALIIRQRPRRKR